MVVYGPATAECKAARVHETKSVLIKKMGEAPESKYHSIVWLSSIWLDSFTSQKMSITDLRFVSCAMLQTIPGRLS